MRPIVSGRERRGERRFLASAIALAIVCVTFTVAHGADDTGTVPASGGTTSGPPAPAAPGVAATPAPAAEPALPNAPVEPGVAARAEPVAAPPPDAKPRKVNLWPLFQYESDPATRTTHWKVFGPLLEYHADADYQRIHFRPLISIRQSQVGHDDYVSILGPFLRSHWGQTEQMTTGLGGLFTYRTRTSADGRTLEMQNARFLPVYFYEWDDPDRRGRVSVIQIYADLDDFLGYDHVEMALFPAYVHVTKKPSLDRYYYPYPIIVRDGPEGSGYRLWPFPLRDREGRRVTRADTTADGNEQETHFPLLRDELDATAPHDPDRS
jgi:hypothetical protein